VPDRVGTALRYRDECGSKPVPLADQVVSQLGPDPAAKNLLGGLRGVVYLHTVDGAQKVTLADTGSVTGAIYTDDPSLNATGRIDPGNPVFRNLVTAALL
jgi:hypothetical protein